MQITYCKTALGREPVRDYLITLTTQDQADIAFDMNLVAQFGPQCDQLVTRHLQGKLWEIKTGTRRQQRIFYCLITGPEIVLLHACKKQKTNSQPRDVELAFKRMKEVLS